MADGDEHQSDYGDIAGMYGHTLQNRSYYPHMPKQLETRIAQAFDEWAEAQAPHVRSQVREHVQSLARAMPNQFGPVSAKILLASVYLEIHEHDQRRKGNNA